MATIEADSAGDPLRFPVDALYTAAHMYYLEDANQATIAERLGTSRATVSRMLAEARRSGIVRIDVIAPQGEDDDQLARELADELDLQAVHLAPTASLGLGVSAALEEIALQPGDVLLVSSGRTVHDITRGDLPPLVGVELVPMIGGQDEPEAWYQTNEIVRLFSEKVGGRPTFLYAPALPGPELYETLMNDQAIMRVLELWRTARCAVVGVGSAPLSRQSLPLFVPTESAGLRDAVGDVCSRFYDVDGIPVPFNGSDRLISTPLQDLQRLPDSIAVAVGRDKVASITAGARAGYFNQLVTDPATAALLVRHVRGHMTH